MAEDSKANPHIGSSADEFFGKEIEPQECKCHPDAVAMLKDEIERLREENNAYKAELINAEFYEKKCREEIENLRCILRSVEDSLYAVTGLTLKHSAAFHLQDIMAELSQYEKEIKEIKARLGLDATATHQDVLLAIDEINKEAGVSRVRKPHKQ